MRNLIFISVCAIYFHTGQLEVPGVTENLKVAFLGIEGEEVDIPKDEFLEKVKKAGKPLSLFGGDSCMIIQYRILVGPMLAEEKVYVELVKGNVFTEPTRQRLLEVKKGDFIVITSTKLNCNGKILTLASKAPSLRIQ